MAGNTPIINGFSKCLNGLIAALIVLAVILVFYSYGQARIELERERASMQTLYKVAELLQLGDEVEKEAIHSQLRQVLNERDVARRMEVARTVGIRVDWDDIFDHVDRLKPEDQERFRQTIVCEYGLPVTLSLEQLRVIMRTVRHIPRPVPPLQVEKIPPLTFKNEP